MPKLVNKLNGTQFNVMQIWLENSNRAPKEFNFYWIWFPLFHTKPPLLMRIWLCTRHFHLPDWSPHRWTQSFCTLLTTHHSRKMRQEEGVVFLLRPGEIQGFTGYSLIAVSSWTLRPRRAEFNFQPSQKNTYFFLFWAKWFKTKNWISALQQEAEICGMQRRALRE